MFVGRSVLVGGAIDVNVDLGGRVRVGEVAVGEGEGVSVFDGVRVMVGEGDEVNVKTEVAVDVNVLVTVGVFVGVVNIVANACIVSALSVLRVGVAVFPPVFGITRSGSYNLSEFKLETMKGKPNAMRQLLMRTTRIKKFLLFTSVVPFVR